MRRRASGESVYVDCFYYGFYMPKKVYDTYSIQELTQTCMQSLCDCVGIVTPTGERVRLTVDRKLKTTKSIFKGMHSKEKCQTVK